MKTLFPATLALALLQGAKAARSNGESTSAAARPVPLKGSVRAASIHSSLTHPPPEKKDPKAPPPGDEKKRKDHPDDKKKKKEDKKEKGADDDAIRSDDDVIIVVDDFPADDAPLMDDITIVVDDVPTTDDFDVYICPEGGGDSCKYDPYNPLVCGDGYTCSYETFCDAIAAGFDTNADCCQAPQPSACTMNYDPQLCGSKQCPYSNLCVAENAGYDASQCSPPPPDCPAPPQNSACPMDYAPVMCSSTSCVYENECVADLAGFDYNSCVPLITLD